MLETSRQVDDGPTVEPKEERETRALLAAFRSCRLAAGDFDHVAHVRVGWASLRESPLPDVLCRFRNDLRRFARSQGADGLYHETITWAYLFWIDERRRRLPTGHSWSEFAASAPELLDGASGLLARAYTPALLASPEARAGFCMPDRSLPDGLV